MSSNGAGPKPGDTIEMPTVDDVLEQPIREATAALAPRPGEEDSRRRGPFWRFLDDLRSIGALRHTPYGLGPLGVFGAIAFFQNFDTQAFNVGGPVFVRDYGIKVDSIISVLVLTAIVTILAALGFGWYADRHKRVPLYALGTAVAGIGSMLSGTGRTTAGLGGARVVDETANAGADVPDFSLLADYYPPDARGRVYSFRNVMVRIGEVTAIVAVGPMLAHWGLRTTFVLAGLPILILGIIAFIVLREPIRGYFERKAVGADEEVARTEDEPQSFGEGWRSTFAVRTLRRLFMADIVIGCGEVCQVFFVFFLAEKYGLSPTQTGFAFLPGALVAIIGGIYGGGLVDRFTTRNPGRVLMIYGLFFLFPALSMAGYALGPPVWVLIALYAVGAFGRSLIGPALLAVYSQVVPPAVRTQGLQVTSLASLPGIIFSLTIAGIIHNKYGYTPVFIYAIPFYVIGGIIAMTAGSFFDIDRRNAFATTVAAEEWRRAKAAGAGKLLVCRGVEVEYEGVQVLFGVDLDIQDGELIALLGTNGAGKSTLLRAISGTQEASGGGIVFDGRDITHMPPHEIAARRIVHMPGGRGVFPALTVAENLMLGGWLDSIDDADHGKDRLAEVYEIFPALKRRAGAAAGLLSGGEQQQLSLAQAFLMQPRLLLIDELSLGLSPAVVGELLEIVKEIHRRGVTIVVVEQSVNVALTLADRAIFMEKGEVRFDGPTAELLGRPDVLRAVYVKGTGALTEKTPAGAGDRRQADLERARPALEVSGIVKRYGGVVAVDDVSLVLREGESLGLIGPNGSGKTTLFDVISGYQSADGGRVVLEGRDISGLPAYERAKLGLVRRFQDARLFPSLTVSEALLVALEQRLEVKSPILSALSAPRARRAERRLRLRADRLIELLSLEAYRDKFVKELSTGVRRVLDLACVLAAEPKVLLLDEPSSGIAQAEAEGLAPLLRRVRFETGCSMLLIEHDMPLISSVSDELVAMDRGRILLRGEPDVVLNDPRVIESYLGGDEAAIQRSGSIS